MTRAKFPYFRSQKHLRNVAALDCQSCGRGGPSQAAHSNSSRHGKGRSIKSSDIYTAALCPRCHAEVDSGKMTRAAREGIWEDAWERTKQQLIARGQWPSIGSFPNTATDDGGGK